MKKIRILREDFERMDLCRQKTGAKQQAWIIRAVLDAPNELPETPRLSLDNSVTIHIPDRIESVDADRIRRAIRWKIEAQMPTVEQIDPLEEAIRNLAKVSGMSLEDARKWAEESLKRAIERQKHEKAKTREKAVAGRG